MDENRISFLSRKWLNKQITFKEYQELEDWYDHFDESVVEVKSADSRDMLKTRIYLKIRSNITAVDKTIFGRIYQWRALALAASVILISTVCIVLYKYNFQESKRSGLTKNAQIQPGMDRAFLTLSNGKQINLDELKPGSIIVVHGMKISKDLNGELNYSMDNTSAYNLGNNTVTTPRGGQTRVALSDGTHVWLNASSSLTYPLGFSSSERLVILRGEGYFEVAHEKNRPFRVKSENQVVQVMGTHFNVNAYNDEHVVKTTLLSGKVKVIPSGNERQSVIIAPGQQATVNSGNDISVKPIDILDATDWKNGEFSFNNESVQGILRKLSRWYDVEFIYMDANKETTFWGSVSRYDTLDKVLEKIELTGNIHFRVDGRKVYVLK